MCLAGEFLLYFCHLIFQNDMVISEARSAVSTAHGKCLSQFFQDSPQNEQVNTTAVHEAINFPLRFCGIIFIFLSFQNSLNRLLPSPVEQQFLNYLVV